MAPTLRLYAVIFTTSVLLRAPLSGAFMHQATTRALAAGEVLPLFMSQADGTRSNLNLVSPGDRSRLKLMAIGNDILGEEREQVLPTPSTAAPAAAVHRRRFLDSIVAGTLGGAVIVSGVLAAPPGASANGMLDFPPAKLNNRYFVMRAAQGGADSEGLIQSHPIDKLHVDNGLTEQGVEEAQRAAGVLRAVGVDNAFIWADISSRAQGTARILAQELNIRQERVVPEYSFLEPRGMGIFDGKEAASILPEVYKADAADAMWRPPPNTNGTPNESVDDVFVRVRQLLSKLETQYQGEDVVIVGADSDCLSVLQSFVLGEELGKHSKYYLRPGEGRQLRVSVDTEIGYWDRREAKGGSVRGEANSSGSKFSAASGRSGSGATTAVVAPPRF